VPRAFQEHLQSRANELVNAVNCPPPAPTTTSGEDDGGEKSRGKKSKDKKDDEKTEDDS
jgi:hypothetical protein